MVIFPFVNIYSGKVHNFKWRLSIDDPGFQDFRDRVNRYRRMMYGPDWEPGDDIQLIELPKFHYVIPWPTQLKTAEAIVNFEFKFCRYHCNNQVTSSRGFTFRSPRPVDELWHECYEQAEKMAKRVGASSLRTIIEPFTPGGVLTGVDEFHVPKMALKSLGSWNSKVNKL